MDRIATAQADERADLFRQASSALRPARSPEVVEKDFWVCWTLRQLFEAMHFRPQLIFKGGTFTEGFCGLCELLWLNRSGCGCHA